ncbi:MAG: DUF523 domain-containing protein [Desulfofustis sp.]|jgi:uncharacterized protein YbbK (DUF523 family)|nr:DUF523 domain-containing protein [Desulfofustis sp.]
MSTKDLILVSACLAGLATRYDGKAGRCPECLEAIGRAPWIPLCPEQLGGLPTPRCPADIINGDGSDVLHGRARVICTDGSDVTAAFIEGARQVLEVARRQPIRTVFMKARSPSCGVSRLGVTAALLQQHGYEVVEFG